ncbi:MAG: sigma-70 family RNA polymerase sigma factor, partial [Chloroflexaceae bacterium]|nr:sigma-70 family RNA polymerase sigma factor [Chloroflexaceae bacterium]
MDEGEAIARLKRGDIGGLEALVRAYQLRAVRATYLITGERAMAEDVVQTAFLRSYERIQQFDTRRPFGPWFLRIVVNDAVKAAARNGRDVSLDARSTGHDPPLAETLAAPAPALIERLERAETEAAVWAALAQLTPGQRAAVVLRYYLNLSEAEMAEELACAPGTVK